MNRQRSGQTLRGRIADRLGICLSALCVVHCLLTPVLLILLPSLELLKFHESYHTAMLVILPLIAIVAFIPGFRAHRDVGVFIWALPGLISIALGAIVFHENAWLEAGFSIFGSLLLIRSHALNRRLCRCCETGHGSGRPRTKAGGLNKFGLIDAPVLPGEGDRLLTSPRRVRTPFQRK